MSRKVRYDELEGVWLMQGMIHPSSWWPGRRSRAGSPLQGIESCKARTGCFL